MYFNILSKKGDIEKSFCFFIFVFFGAVFFNEWLPTIVIVGDLLIAIILGVCYMAIMFKIAGLHREIANEFKKGATAIVVNGIAKSTCIQQINGYYSVHGGGSYRHPLMAINNANRVIGSIIGYAVVRNDIHVEIRAKKQIVRKKN